MSEIGAATSAAAMGDTYDGSVRTALYANMTKQWFCDRPLDCAAVRDDAAKPRLTVPRNLIDRRKPRC